MPPALDGVSFSLQPGDKVGVVGRTGAGKSSLLAALFRLSPTTGSILVDGVDLARVPLERLRRSISVIPQDPVLFSGSMRYNLDPFGDFTDADMWAALEAVQLKEVITQLPGGAWDGVAGFKGIRKVRTRLKKYTLRGQGQGCRAFRFYACWDG